MSEYACSSCVKWREEHTLHGLLRALQLLATSPGTLVKTWFLANVNTDVGLISLYKLHVCKWPFLALSSEGYTQDRDLVSKCHPPLKHNRSADQQVPNSDPLQNHQESIM